jgi:transposase
VERSEAEAIYDQGREVVVAVLLRMDEQIQRLEQRIARQDERIAQLERRLNRSSRNSSVPPSADPPSSPPRRSKDPSGRKPGAQPGHQGHGRGLLGACAVDEVVEHWPERCGCGHVFCEAELHPDGEPARRQVEELPVMTVKVVEHRAQRLRCPECGARACAELPDEVAASVFGPRLQAALVALSVRNRVSRRDVVELGEELFGARLSIGSVDAILTRASDALAEPYEDLLGRVRAAGALNADKTGWRTAGERRALWACSPAATRSSRSRVIATRITPRVFRRYPQAIITSDRWWAYRNVPLYRRQLCWSHPQRDFAAHAEGLAAEKEIPSLLCRASLKYSGLQVVFKPNWHAGFRRMPGDSWRLSAFRALLAISA